MRKLTYMLSALMLFALMSFNLADVFNTSLKINVRNELGNIEEGVAVRLYGSEEDYRNEENAATGVEYTDKKGNVKFKDLESKIYFVNASKGDKNNIGAGVQTDMLEDGKMNKVTIIIE